MDKQLFHLAIDKKMYEAIKKAAEKENRTISNFILTAVKEKIERG